MIPRTVHMVWVGSSPPEWVEDRWRQWAAFLSGWSFKYWTDDTFEQWPSSHRNREQCPHPVVLSDLIRIEMVFRQGGIYLDADIFPLRSLDPLAGDRRSWVCTLPKKEKYEAANCAFGFSPGHPALVTLFAQAQHRIRTRQFSQLHYYAGPPLWDLAFSAHPDVELLSVDAFSPLRWSDRRRRIPAALESSLPEIRRRFPATYGIHEYEQSWNPRTKAMHT